MLFFAITVAQGSGEDLVAAQQCYKLSNVHPPTSYEVRGSPLTAPTLAFPPPVLAYCCSRGLLFTIVVHQGYCCSVVTVNNNNTVQKLTFGNSMKKSSSCLISPVKMAGIAPISEPTASFKPYDRLIMRRGLMARKHRRTLKLRSALLSKLMDEPECLI